MPARPEAVPGRERRKQIRLSPQGPAARRSPSVFRDTCSLPDNRSHLLGPCFFQESPYLILLAGRAGNENPETVLGKTGIVTLRRLEPRQASLQDPGGHGGKDGTENHSLKADHDPGYPGEDRFSARNETEGEMGIDGKAVTPQSAYHSAKKRKYADRAPFFAKHLLHLGEVQRRDELSRLRKNLSFRPRSARSRSSTYVKTARSPSLCGIRTLLRTDRRLHLFLHLGHGDRRQELDEEQEEQEEEAERAEGYGPVHPVGPVVSPGVGEIIPCHGTDR